MNRPSINQVIAHCNETIYRYEKHASMEVMANSREYMEHLQVAEWLNELKTYQDTGLSPEQITKLKEKQEPRKVLAPLSMGSKGICPMCSAAQMVKRNYCYNCGQALKWG